MRSSPTGRVTAGAPREPRHPPSRRRGCDRRRGRRAGRRRPRREVEYDSTGSGAAKRTVTRPMSLSASSSVGARRRASRSSRPSIERTIASTVREPCLTSSRAPGRSGSSPSQQASAVTSWRSGTGSLGGGDEVAPADVDVVGEADRHRLGATATSSERSPRSMPATVVREPDGSTTTSSPTRTEPEASWPGVPAVLDVLGGAGGALGADDDLHRHPERLVHGVGVGRQGLEQLEERGPVVPGRVRPTGRRRCRRRAPRRAPRGRPGCRAAAAIARTSAATVRNTSSLCSTRSILFTAMTTCGTRISAATARWRRVCSSTPLRASTSSTRASAVDDPVTVLRVYCTCPGQSASTKERCAVAK